jgi:hypothetical protein
LHTGAGAWFLKTQWFKILDKIISGEIGFSYNICISADEAALCGIATLSQLKCFLTEFESAQNGMKKTDDNWLQ